MIKENPNRREFMKTVAQGAAALAASAIPTSTEASLPKNTNIEDKINYDSVDQEEILRKLEKMHSRVLSVIDYAITEAEDNDTANTLKEIKKILEDPNIIVGKIVAVYNYIFDPNKTDVPDSLSEADVAKEILDILKKDYTLQ